MWASGPCCHDPNHISATCSIRSKLCLIVNFWRGVDDELRDVVFIVLNCHPGDSFEQDLAITAGWGRIKSGGRTSNFLKKANVTVIDNGDCNSSHGGMITGNMICAYDAIKSSCNGDSGGPLMCRQNDKLVMCGVVSWGRRGCLGAPVVYVRTTGAQFNALKNLMEIMAKAAKVQF